MNSRDADRQNGAEWSALMARAQDGDRKAYETLLRQAVPYIRAVVRRIHAAPDRSEEVVQDVLLTVHRVRHTYDPARPFGPWLAAIARRRSIDALRRRRRTEAHEVSDAVAYETFADPAANRQEEKLATAAGLNAAVAGLPARQREAIRLLKLRGLSLAEASVESGTSIAALKVNVHRAIKSLRKRMTGENES
ncbi:MAG: sigma-70 family RNA polymerase sigma factor [Alphaproteobacteria bacterium]|nr:sigma-70 family RNA polymerase sigma factor [Alphaproteobacteria bacterium]